MCTRRRARSDQRQGSSKRLGDVTCEGTIFRGFEEDVKHEDVCAGATHTATLRMLLALAIDGKSEQCTTSTEDVTTSFFKVGMKERDVEHAKPLPEWRPETLDSTLGPAL